MLVEFESMYKAAMNMADAKIESVHNLDKKQLEEIEKFLEKRYKKKFEIKAQLNEDLIGGFLIRLDDLVIDKSTRYHLKQLETALLAE